MKRLLLALLGLLWFAVPASAQLNCVIQNGVTYCGNGVVFTTPVFVTSIGFTSASGTAADTFLARAAANALKQQNSSNVQAFQLGPGTVPTFNTLNQHYVGDAVVMGSSGAGGEVDFGYGFYYNSGWKYRFGSGAAGKIGFNTVSSGCWSVQTGGGGSIDAAISWVESMRWCTSAVTVTAAQATASAAAGVTTNMNGGLQSGLLKVTVDGPTAFRCAATTCDVTIVTLPANTRVLTVDGAVTTAFACTATCTSSTLSIMLGKGSGGSEYLAAGLDVDAGTTWFGNTDDELGSLMTRAAAIQGGTFSTGTQAVVVRLTSGTGNIGNGSASNLSQGTLVFYLLLEVMP